MAGERLSGFSPEDTARNREENQKKDSSVANVVQLMTARVEEKFGLPIREVLTQVRKEESSVAKMAERLEISTRGVKRLWQCYFDTPISIHSSAVQKSWRGESRDKRMQTHASEAARTKRRASIREYLDSLEGRVDRAIARIGENPREQLQSLCDQGVRLNERCQLFGMNSQLLHKVEVKLGVVRKEPAVIERERKRKTIRNFEEKQALVREAAESGMLGRLTPTQREVLESLYLDPTHIPPYQEVARKRGTTRQAVQGAAEKGLRKLGALRARGFL